MKEQLLKLLISVATVRKVTSAQWSAIETTPGQFDNYHKILFHNTKVFTIITTTSPDGRPCFGINFPFVGSLFIYGISQKTEEEESIYGYHYNGLFKEWSDGDLTFSDKTAQSLSFILEPFIQHNGLSNKQLSDQGLPVAKIKEIIRTHSLNTPTSPTIPDTELVEEDNMKSKDNLQDTPKTDKETSTEEVIVEEKEVKKFKQKVPFTANAFLRLVEVKDHVNGGIKKLVGFFTKGLETIGDVDSDHLLVNAMSYLENRCTNGAEFRLHQREEGVELSLHFPKSFDYDKQTMSKYTLNLGLLDVHFMRYITPAPDDCSPLDFEGIGFVGIGDNGVFNVYSNITEVTDMGEYQDIHEVIVFPTPREVEVEVIVG